VFPQTAEQWTAFFTGILAMTPFVVGGGVWMFRIDRGLRAINALADRMQKVEGDVEKVEGSVQKHARDIVELKTWRRAGGHAQ
jgi:hypothetical protein